MNFRDKAFQISFVIVVASLAGLLFPAFVRYIFVIALIIGIGGLCYWVWKNLAR